jgi:uncharacterized protein (TIGR00297 family)
MVAQLLIGLLCASAIAAVSRSTALLTPSGAIAQFFLGWTLLGLGGWKWAVPLLVFFVSSSMFSRLARARKSSVEQRYAKAGSRDALQVLANGGIAGVMVMADFLFPSPHWYVAALGSVGAATADTWGTEIGVLSHRSPLLLTTLKTVEPGTSGGLSLLGSSIGGLGGIIIGVSGILWVDPGARVQTILIVAFSAVLGAFLDSLLGATTQAQYQCSICLSRTERSSHCEIPAIRVRGVRFITNDTVNLVCTASGGMMAGIFSFC